MPNVSIVIPVYNVEMYLTKCVESVLAQTYQDFELLLVDDGSTDNSGMICDAYIQKDSRVQVIHQNNQGQGGARNNGISAAKGKYLLFVDSDDYIHPQLLEKTVAVAEAEKCDVVMFNAVAVNENGVEGVSYRFSLPPDIVLEREALKPFVTISGVWNRLWNRQLFMEYDIRFPSRVWYEDLYVPVKFAPHFRRAYYLDCQPLYYYFQRLGSTMHTPDFERIVRERIAAVTDCCTYYEENHLIQDYREELDYLGIFHGYFLPIREMCGYGLPFKKYAHTLKKNLLKYCNDPFHNPYFQKWGKKEKLMMQLFWSEWYWAVKRLVKMNNYMKKIHK